MSFSARAPSPCDAWPWPTKCTATGLRRATHRRPHACPGPKEGPPTQGLLEGDVPAAPPAPLAGVSEAALRGAELREGAPLEPGARLPCTVSFTRGQERAVALTVAGLPPARPPPVPGPLLGGTGSGKAAPRMTPGPSRGGWAVGVRCAGMHGASPQLPVTFQAQERGSAHLSCFGDPGVQRGTSVRRRARWSRCGRQ